MSDLPKGWVHTHLEGVVEIRDSERVPINSRDRESRNGNVPYFGATGQVGWIDDFIFDEELVLLGEDGAPFMDPLKPKAYLVSGKSWVNNHAHVLVGLTGINNKFLLHQLNATKYDEFVSGTTRLKLPQGTMKKIPLVIAPATEQTRIVGEIEKQLSRLDAATAALKRVQANLKRYRASVLKAACEGRLVPTEAELARKEGRDYESADKLLERILRERRSRWEADTLAKMIASGKPPKDDRWKQKYKEPSAPDTTGLPALPGGWCWASVEQLAAAEANALTDGPFGSNLKTSHYTADGPRVIRLQNIGDGQFLNAKAHIAESHYKKLIKHAVHAGDIVIAALGDPAPRACMVPMIGPSIVKADCIRYKPSAETSSAYILAALNSDGVRKRTTKKIHGIGRPRLSLGEIREIMLPLPPILEQQRIASALHNFSENLERQTEVVRTLEIRCLALRQSTLRHAFTGQLVPQDPAEEPASVLLDRIRAERASQIPARSSRRGTRRAVRG